LIRASGIQPTRSQRRQKSTGRPLKGRLHLLTAGHRDHVGDAVEIAQNTGAALICNPECAGNLVKLAGFPNKRAETDAIVVYGNSRRQLLRRCRIAQHRWALWNGAKDVSESRTISARPAGDPAALWNVSGNSSQRPTVLRRNSRS